VAIRHPHARCVKPVYRELVRSFIISLSRRARRRQFPPGLHEYAGEVSLVPTLRTHPAAPTSDAFDIELHHSCETGSLRNLAGEWRQRTHGRDCLRMPGRMCVLNRCADRYLRDRGLADLLTDRQSRLQPRCFRNRLDPSLPGLVQRRGSLNHEGDILACDRGRDLSRPE
jgi:hypothetical protein